MNQLQIKQTVYRAPRPYRFPWLRLVIIALIGVAVGAIGLLKAAGE